MTDWLEIGKIVGAHGLQGTVRVYPSSDFPERFLQPGERWLLRPGVTEPEPVRFKGGRFQEGKGLFLVDLEGIKDRDQAEALRDCRLMVLASDRPHLEPGEFHVTDLVGLSVFDQQSQALIGIVVDLGMAGNDLLIVQHPESQAEFLIPFVQEIVPIVDLEQKRIEINPPQGLLDLSSSP